MIKTVTINDIQIGQNNPLVIIAGPCVIESLNSTIEHCEQLKGILHKVGLPFIFKSSYDKANRTSINSFRGPGLTKGLEILETVKKKFNVSIISDVHSVIEIKEASQVLDILQIPAFLSRQTDLVVEAAKTGKTINIKKAQFMSPEEIKNVVLKVETTKNNNILITERGTSFGYNMLVNDFRSIPIMAETGYPIVYDATHSVQRPGGKGASSGGDSKYVFALSKAAVAVGCNVLFLEVHENPEKALSDGSNMVKIKDLEDFLFKIKEISEVIRKQ